MRISFRNSNYKATLSQSKNYGDLIHPFVQPSNPLPSNNLVLKCATSKASVRLSPAVDDSDFYEADDEVPIRSMIFDKENTAPGPALTFQDEKPSDDENNATAPTFFWHNPFFNEMSRSYFQQCSYWNK